ncbi:hypothetical protein BH10PLA2_BH10PLA2_00860 [soil metagenome]
MRNPISIAILLLTISACSTNCHSQCPVRQAFDGKSKDDLVTYTAILQIQYDQCSGK